MDLLSSLFASSGEYFTSFFQNVTLVGVLLAALFGIFWLIFYRSNVFKADWLWAPLLFLVLLAPFPWSLVIFALIAVAALFIALRKPSLLKTHWLWAVIIPGAFIAAIAAAYIQAPLQQSVAKLLLANWTEEQLMRGFLFTSLPTIFIAALVLEGSKLLPVIAYWKHKNKKVDPKFALVIGAVAGAGFGILANQNFFNLLSSPLSGWSLEALSVNDITTLLPLFDGFFSTVFNIAMTALAGYGLAKGMGWQFYFIVAGVHSLMDYLLMLFQLNLLNLASIETLIGIIATGSFIVTMWLLKRKEPKPAITEAKE